MDRIPGILVAGSVFNDPTETTAILIGIVAAVVVCSLPGAVGILAVTRLRSARTALWLQVPFQVTGLALAVVGIVLLLGPSSPAVALGLLAGGVMAVVEASAYMVVCLAIWRRRQPGETRH